MARWEKRIRRGRPASGGTKGLSASIIHRQFSFVNSDGFTLIELLVVVSLIALLLTLLLPSLRRVRHQAKAIVCQAKIRQWGLAYKIYTDENDGRWFPLDRPDGRFTWNYWLRWIPELVDYPNMAACPRAATTWEYGTPYDAFTAWWSKDWQPLETSLSGKPIRGPISYAFNCLVSRPRDTNTTITEEARKMCWGTCDVREAGNVPVLFDSSFRDPRPNPDDPPPSQGAGLPVTGGWSMCIDRHDGGINMLFMDWSTRKVGLKELWTLKWNRTFDTAGPWTKQGGVQPEDWPHWMRGFRDY